MFKYGAIAAAALAVGFASSTVSTSANALPVAKPAVKQMTLKHDVRRWRRGGFRRFGLRRGLRLGIRRGFRGRRFYRGYYPRRRFYRPRARIYYGAPVYGYRYRRHHRGGCRWLKKRYKYTGNPYWWHRYKRCKFGRYY